LHWPSDIAPEQLLAGSAHGHALASKGLREGQERIAVLLESGLAADELEARWALTVVDSRAFTFNAGTSDAELALVPLLDIFNTFVSGEEAGSELWHGSFEPQGPVADGGLLVAERLIESGEEIVHLYESNSSARLWMNYGFLPEGENPLEVAAVDVDVQRILTKDCHAVKAAKLQTLRRAGFQADSAPLHFELPLDAEIGGTLLPVARLLACRGEEDVSVLEPCLVQARSSFEIQRPQDHGVILEARARGMVVDWLREALRDADKASERLRASLEAEDSDPSQAIELSLQRLALRLLRLERPVLELELEASEAFGDDVVSLGISPWALGDDALTGPDRDVLFQLKDKYWTDETGWLGAG